MQATIYTVLAMLAFAANSLLCRWALADNLIDAGSFSIIRLLAGSVMLTLIVQFSTSKNCAKSSRTRASKLLSAGYLAVYAFGFSYAYIALSTATGALILFAAVQFTMMISAKKSGHHFNRHELIGITISVIGFVVLVAPKLSSPSLNGLVLMTISGIAWGLYSVQKSNESPLKTTQINFVYSLWFIPVAVTLQVLLNSNISVSLKGGLLAVISGAITSGIGYSLWYKAISLISTTQAAIVQLSVPLIAAIMGLIILSEIPSIILIISSTMILSGIFLVFSKR